MSGPDLIYMFDAEDEETGVSCLLEVDKNTGELYFNKKKVVTDIQLAKRERIFGLIVTVSTAIIAICSVLDIVIRCVS